MKPLPNLVTINTRDHKPSRDGRMCTCSWRGEREEWVQHIIDILQDRFDKRTDDMP